MAKAPKGPKGAVDLAADIQKMSFEAALNELEEIVQKLESGDVDLEKSIEIYSRGAQLKQHCDLKLKDAQARIDKIVTDGDGAIATEAFTAD